MDERTTDVPSYNIYYNVKSQLGRQHTKAPLVAALILFMNLPNP